MKKLLMLFAVVLLFAACGKDDDPVNPDPIDPPPPVYKAEITVAFALAPADWESHPVAFGVLDTNLLDNVIVVDYNHINNPHTIVFTKEQAQAYLGKTVYLYYRTCRSYNLQCYGLEVYHKISPLKETNEVVNIPFPTTTDNVVIGP